MTPILDPEPFFLSSHEPFSTEHIAANITLWLNFESFNEFMVPCTWSGISKCKEIEEAIAFAISMEE